MKPTLLRTIVWRAVLACLLLAAPGYLLYKHLYPTSTLDAPMRSAVAQANKVAIYSQHVETQTQFPDRILKIVGTYYVDNANKEYAAYSTTTLLIAGDKIAHTFTYDDINTKDDVFYKTQTTDKFLMHAITNSPGWLRFKSNAIPADQMDLAIAGPLQDNLSVLSNQGRYLTFVKKDGPHYTFTLSKDAANAPSGPLKAIVDRLGTSGTVDVLLDPATFKVTHLVFQNAPYYSTTTITQINVRTPITPPAGGQAPH